MKEKLFIYGAGGLGREILSMLKLMEQWEPAGFFDDRLPPGTHIAGLNVIGGKQALLSIKVRTNVIIAIGDPRVKTELVTSLINPYIFFPSVVHPIVVLQDTSTITIGNGTTITAGCILTTNINIGDHVLLNLNSTIGHDVNIGNFSSVMPGVNIAGEVNIGNSVLIGSGANILNRVRIGNRAKVGMGGVVINDVPDGVTVVGVPAKPVNR